MQPFLSMYLSRFPLYFHMIGFFFCSFALLSFLPLHISYFTPASLYIKTHFWTPQFHFLAIGRPISRTPLYVPMEVNLTDDLLAQLVAALFLVDLWIQKSLPPQDHGPLLETVVNLIENSDPTNNSYVQQQLFQDLIQFLSPETCILLKKRVKSLDSVDKLQLLIAAVAERLCPPNIVSSPDPEKVHPSSFFGKFIVKVVTTSNLMLFGESSLLYSSFSEYAGLKEIATVNLDSAKDEALFTTLRAQLTDFSITMNQEKTSVTLTKHEMAKWLDSQIYLLEANGTPTPVELERIMMQMISPESPNSLIQNPEFGNLPQWYYLQYLEALRDLDYHAATKSLHQYFDYMVLTNSKYFYHFALIQKAALHQHFGENESALAAIEEAILVARENKDISTLTYILLWLFNFMRTRPELWTLQPFYQTELHLLEFLVTRLQQVSLPLYLMLYQFVTLHFLNSGKGLPKVLELLLKSVYIALNGAPNPALPKSLEFASSIWHRVGSPRLTDLYANIEVERNRAEQISLEIRKAYFLYETSQIDLAMFLLDLLQGVQLTDRVLLQQVQVRRLILLTKMYLNRGRNAVAQKMLDTLLDSNVSDSELGLELALLNAEAQMAFGNYYSALKFISATLNELEYQSVMTNLHTSTRLRLAKAKVLVKTGLPSKALPLVVQELRVSKKLGMMSLVVEGIVVLAAILNALETPHDCYDLLEASMPNIHLVGNDDLTAQAYYHFAISCWKLISTSGLVYRNKKLINQFLRFLNLAIDGFKKMLNLVLLVKCFELERDMANGEGLSDLEDHAVGSLTKLKTRIREEANYGFVGESLN